MKNILALIAMLFLSFTATATVKGEDSKVEAEYTLEIGNLQTLLERGEEVKIVLPPASLQLFLLLEKENGGEVALSMLERKVLKPFKAIMDTSCFAVVKAACDKEEFWSDEDNDKMVSAFFFIDRAALKAAIAKGESIEYTISSSELSKALEDHREGLKAEAESDALYAAEGDVRRLQEQVAKLEAELKASK